jgi:hypothetical protein
MIRSFPFPSSAIIMPPLGENDAWFTYLPDSPWIDYDTWDDDAWDFVVQVTQLSRTEFEPILQDWVQTMVDIRRKHRALLQTTRSLSYKLVSYNNSPATVFGSSETCIDSLTMLRNQQELIRLDEAYANLAATADAAAVRHLTHTLATSTHLEDVRRLVCEHMATSNSVRPVVTIGLDCDVYGRGYILGADKLPGAPTIRLARDEDRMCPLFLEMLTREWCSRALFVIEKAGDAIEGMRDGDRGTVVQQFDERHRIPEFVIRINSADGDDLVREVTGICAMLPMFAQELSRRMKHKAVVAFQFDRPLVPVMNSDETFYNFTILRDDRLAGINQAKGMICGAIMSMPRYTSPHLSIDFRFRTKGHEINEDTGVHQHTDICKAYPLRLHFTDDESVWDYAVRRSNKVQSTPGGSIRGQRLSLDIHGVGYPPAFGAYF